MMEMTAMTYGFLVGSIWVIALLSFYLLMVIVLNRVEERRYRRRYAPSRTDIEEFVKANVPDSFAGSDGHGATEIECQQILTTGCACQAARDGEYAIDQSGPTRE